MWCWCCKNNRKLVTVVCSTDHYHGQHLQKHRLWHRAQGGYWGTHNLSHSWTDRPTLWPKSGYLTHIKIQISILFINVTGRWCASGEYLFYMDAQKTSAGSRERKKPDNQTYSVSVSLRGLCLTHSCKISWMDYVYRLYTHTQSTARWALDALASSDKGHPSCATVGGERACGRVRVQVKSESMNGQETTQCKSSWVISISEDC